MDRLQQAPITPLESLKELGVMRLASRVHDLRRLGISIKSVTVKEGDKTFSKYYLGTHDGK